MWVTTLWGVRSRSAVQDGWATHNIKVRSMRHEAYWSAVQLYLPSTTVPPFRPSPQDYRPVAARLIHVENWGGVSATSGIGGSTGAAALSPPASAPKPRGSLPGEGGGSGAVPASYPPFGCSHCASVPRDVLVEAARVAAEAKITARGRASVAAVASEADPPPGALGNLSIPLPAIGDLHNPHVVLLIWGE